MVVLIRFLNLELLLIVYVATALTTFALCLARLGIGICLLELLVVIVSPVQVYLLGLRHHARPSGSMLV
jgi:hypothetical protein